MWPEIKRGAPGFRVRLGKRAFGRACERWFPSEKDAEQWVLAEEKRVARMGRSIWVPTREQLLELEEVIRIRDSVVSENLRLTPLARLVERDIRDARRLQAIGRITLGEAGAAWLAAKSKKSEQHRQKSTLVYDRFAAWFGANKSMQAVTAADADRWTRSLGVSENTRTRYVRRLSTLWRWAAKPQRRWVTENPWDEIEVEPLQHARPGILTLEQVSALLRTAAQESRQPLLPFLVLALFAGPRVAEAKRLDWSAVCLEPGEEGIRLDPDQTKTGSRRWVPLPPVAVEWLKRYTGVRQGAVAPTSWNFRRERLLARAGFRIKAVVSGKSGRLVTPFQGEPKWDWPRNGLRHSFCSYGVAHLRNLAEVSFRAGNSERVLRRDYMAVVTGREATAYFALLPNVVLGE